MNVEKVLIVFDFLSLLSVVFWCGVDFVQQFGVEIYLLYVVFLLEFSVFVLFESMWMCEELFYVGIDEVEKKIVVFEVEIDFGYCFYVIKVIELEFVVEGIVEYVDVNFIDVIVLGIYG